MSRNANVRVRPSHLPLIVVMWLFTALAMSPLPSLAYMLQISMLLNLTSCLIAVGLLCSPSRTDKIHAGMRLACQVVVIVFVAVMMLRDPFLLQCLLGAMHKFAP